MPIVDCGNQQRKQHHEELSSLDDENEDKKHNQFAASRRASFACSRASKEELSSIAHAQQIAIRLSILPRENACFGLRGLLQFIMSRKKMKDKA